MERRKKTSKKGCVARIDFSTRSHGHALPSLQRKSTASLEEHFQFHVSI